MDELDRLKVEAQSAAESDPGFDERLAALDGAPEMSVARGVEAPLGVDESLVLREPTNGEPNGTPIAEPNAEEESTRLGNALLLQRGDVVIACDVVKAVAPGTGSSALERLRQRLGRGHAGDEVVTAAADVEADVRTLPVRFDAAGRRFRDYADCMALVHEVELQDWPLDGPRTLREYADLIRRRGGTRSGCRSRSSTRGRQRL